jgi:hypothetical protein
MLTKCSLVNVFYTRNSAIYRQFEVMIMFAEYWIFTNNELFDVTPLAANGAAL